MGTTKTRTHASHEAHHAVTEEAHHFLDDHTGDGPAATAEQALALVRKLQLTGPEVDALLAAHPLTPEQIAQGPKVNVAAIARAYPSTVSDALAAADCPIIVRAVPRAEIATHAQSVRRLASASAKLRAGAATLDATAKSDAEALDKVTHDIHDQVQSRAKLDPTTEQTYNPLLAYWAERYPGRHGTHTPPSGGGDPSGGHS